MLDKPVSKTQGGSKSAGPRLDLQKHLTDLEAAGLLIRIDRPSDRAAFAWFGQKLPLEDVVTTSGEVRSGLSAIGSAATNCPGWGGQSMLVSCEPCGVHAPPGFAPALQAPLTHFGQGDDALAVR